MRTEYGLEGQSSIPGRGWFSPHCSIQGLIPWAQTG
jgi:hypothetical protein